MSSSSFAPPVDEDGNVIMTRARSGTQIVAEGEYEAISTDDETTSDDSALEDALPAIVTTPAAAAAAAASPVDSPRTKPLPSKPARNDSDDSEDDDDDDDESDDRNAMTRSSGSAMSVRSTTAADDDAGAHQGWSRDEAIARYRGAQEKLREAKSTIASLIDQITDYQSVMESEKEALEQQLMAKEAVHQEEKKFMLQLLDEAEQKQEKQNADTMRNLSTLMVELENIEEHNNALSLELEDQRLANQKLLDDQQAADDLAADLRKALAAAEARIAELEAGSGTPAAPAAAAPTAAATAVAKPKIVVQAPPLASVPEYPAPPLPPSPGPGGAPAPAAAPAVETQSSPRRPHLQRAPTFTKGLATVATGVHGPVAEVTANTPDSSPLLSEQDLARMSSALDDFLLLPRSQQARMYTALYNAAQRARIAAPFVARLASAFGHHVNVLDAVNTVMSVAPRRTASDVAPVTSSVAALATPARGASMAPPVTRADSSLRRRSFVLPQQNRDAHFEQVAAQRQPGDEPSTPQAQQQQQLLNSSMSAVPVTPSSGAYATIENMKEMLRAEVQNRTDRMATLRAIPKEAGERAAMLAPNFATLRRPNLKRNNRSRSVTTQLSTDEMPPTSPGLPPDAADIDLRRGSAPVPVKQSALGVAASALGAAASAKPTSRPRAGLATAVATAADVASQPAGAAAAATATATALTLPHSPSKSGTLLAGGENEYEADNRLQLDWYEVKQLETAPLSIQAVGTDVWVGDTNGAVHIWDAAVVEQLADLYAQLEDNADEIPPSIAPKQTFSAHGKAVSAIVCVTKNVWTAGKDGVVAVWSRAGKFVCRMEKHKAPITSLVHVVQQKTVWSAASDRQIVVWDAKSSKALKSIKTDNLLVSLCVHNDDVWVGTESTIAVYNARTYNRGNTLKGHSKTVHAIVSVDAQTVWSCSEDMTVCVWTSLGIMRHQIKLQSKLMTLLAVERHIWVGDRDGHIVIYDSSTLAAVDTLDDVHGSACNAICVAPVPDSKRVSVWSGAMDRALVVFATPYSFDTTTGRYSASVEVDAKSHDWLKVKFKSTTVCKKCKHDIWSLVGGRQGLVCRKCKIALHKKCALDLEGECVRRGTAGSSFNRKSAIQRARRTVQFDPAVSDTLEHAEHAEHDAPPASSAASSSSSAATAAASSTGSAVAGPPPGPAPVPAAAASAAKSPVAVPAAAATAVAAAAAASATKAPSPALENDLMNEALRLRSNEGDNNKGTRRRSDSNPILLAAGLREASQRGSGPGGARNSPTMSRRQGDEGGNDTMRRTVSIGPATGQTMSVVAPAIVNDAAASPVRSPSTGSTSSQSQASPARLSATEVRQSPRRDTSSPAPVPDEHILAIIDNAHAEAKAEIERNATLTDSTKAAADSPKEGSRAMKKLNRLTAAFKKSPVERPPLERHSTLDMPVRLPSKPSEGVEMPSPGRADSDSEQSKTDPVPAGDAEADPAASGDAPLCERCRQRKAKARVTMPDGLQSLMCRRCTTEIQRLGTGGGGGSTITKPRKSKQTTNDGTL